MNSIGWNVGHMAWHEQRSWLTRLADVTLEPILNEVAASGGPMATPSLKAMLKSWKVFGIRSTISAQALSLGVRGCGGAIDVAVITRPPFGNPRHRAMVSRANPVTTRADG